MLKGLLIHKEGGDDDVSDSLSTQSLGSFYLYLQTRLNSPVPNDFQKVIS